VSLAVIIPTKNRAAIVGTAVKSALDLRPLVSEIVVVDDGSRDETQAVLGSFGSSIRVAQGGGGGVCSARNAGLAQSASEWVVLLDDDDCLTRHWAGPQVVDALALGDVGLVCGASRFVSSGSVLRPEPMGAQYYGLTGSVLSGSWAVRREVIDRTGGYEPRIRHSENIELFLRLAADRVAFAWGSKVIDEVLVDRGGPPDATTRASSNNAAKVEATQFLLQHHRDQLMLLPAGLASLVRAGAVAAAREGRLALARRWFRMAALYGDHRIADAVRWLTALSGPTSRLAWDRHSS
jgi:hypothetical protein